MLKANSHVQIDAKVDSVLDIRSGQLPIGHCVEARCLRVDAPEWRYELGHSWPNGISLFVENQRVMKKAPDAENDVDDRSYNPGPCDLTRFSARRPLEFNPRPLSVGAAITAKKTEQWALGLVLVEPAQSDEQICQLVANKQAPVQDRMQLDLDRVRLWVMLHRPDRVSKKDSLRCVEPPVLKLVCCTSLSRIETAARGSECDHLQCFDLAAYMHTMRNIPPKHAWCCPICDKPAPLHQLRLDAFAQSVLESTASNVTEVLVADNGKFEVSATDEPEPESSDEELPPALANRPTQAQLQQAALNLGRAFAAPAPAPPRPQPATRERSRSPRRCSGAGPQKVKADEAPTAAVAVEEKMLVWEKLQGIERKVPVKEETRIGWLPEKATCSRCEKNVVNKGGVYCGRRRPAGGVRGCFAAICWKCMNKYGKELGSIRTTKAEFTDLGPDAWWMHEACMDEADRRAYFGEEEDIGKPKDLEDDSDDGGGKFAWE